ncbi:acyl-CoA dehydrogenase family protein [Phormidium tenue FACHB-886]|nr:acyl-CoA dehydrogenase family protein [Phormidium tenue FACHB-886]
MQLAVKAASYQAIAQALAVEFAETAVERDAQGGTPKAERDRLRQSGLLKLVIPQEHGGFGETWITLLQIVREFAKVDSSIAHVFSYHHLGVTVPHIFGTLEQREKYYRQTAEQDWFWCNALNPLDRRVTLTPEGNGFRLNGTKSFCSGSVDSNLMPVTAVQEGVPGLTVVVVPTQREGVLVHGDWDNIGQRQTDSGNVTFNNVWIDSNEILLPNTEGNIFKTIRACLTQINFTNIYLGIALGAFEAAQAYTQTTTRPWINSGVDQATHDPYILHHYGEMWMKLQAAIALTNQAGELVQAAWEKQYELTAAERGNCAVAIAAAKAFVTQVGLEVTSTIFEVMGTRATASKYGFDRYWRNLRVFTLHDPVDYKIRNIGNWVLNDEFPTPDFYS